MISRLTKGEVSVSTLAEPFGMTLPAFAQHLKVLDDCGLTASEKRGRSPWWRLEPARFDETADWMEAERRRWAERLDRLEVYWTRGKSRMKDKADAIEIWSLDREIVLVKLLTHPRETVFAAWMGPRALAL